LELQQTSSVVYDQAAQLFLLYFGVALVHNEALRFVV
jgi:hypothetical protein